MNAELLHAIAKKVKEDLQQTRIVENLRELGTALQNLANQPQNTSLQQTVATKKNEIFAALDNAPSNNFSPFWRHLLSQIGADNLLGAGLKPRIQEIFDQNDLTPIVASQQIQPIVQALTALESAINALLTAFPQLHIGAEDLSAGEAEAGLLIPRKAVHNDLGEFAEELKDVRFILETFIEITTGKTKPLQIRSLSSSDLTVYVALSSWTAAGLAVALEKIIENYKKILEIRKLHAELRKSDVPPESLKGIEAYADDLMRRKIRDEIAQMIEEKFSAISDNSRKNELHNKLVIAL